MVRNINLTGLVNLAQLSLGARVLSATDEYFADKENLLNPKPPKYLDGKFTERGKWMDGWESRRRRDDGHDYCVVQICRGQISVIEVNTQFFTGNYPEQVMIEAADCGKDPDESTRWVELLPKTMLRGNSQNYFNVESDQNWSHIRMHIYPDGGVARLRVYGRAYKNWDLIPEGETVELLGMAHGGLALACSDMHFGNMWNLLAPGRAANMGEGWETARRRGPGHDWVVIQLARPGTVREIELDTLHFKGNFPASCTVRSTYAPGILPRVLMRQDYQWETLHENVPLHADTIHLFDRGVLNVGVISHVKLEIYPDGGVGRLRMYGEVASDTLGNLKAIPLTSENFKPFGDVIETAGHDSRQINFGHADRYENLADLDLTEGGTPAISIFKARPISAPFQITRLERHPHSSQTFIPKGKGRFLVVVAEAKKELDLSSLKLFVSDGNQGINYKRGIWHHFLMALDKEQEFIVIDRSDPDANTEVVELESPYPIITSF